MKEDLLSKILNIEPLSKEVELLIAEQFYYYYLNNSNKIVSGFYHHEDVKSQISESTKLYWSSNAGRLKKQRLIKRNKENQSQNMSKLWLNPTEAMKNRKCEGRPKGSKDLKTRKSRTQRKICIDGMYFENAETAAKVYNIHPVNVRRRCKLEKYPNWSYIL